MFQLEGIKYQKAIKQRNIGLQKSFKNAHVMNLQDEVVNGEKGDHEGFLRHIENLDFIL